MARANYVYKIHIKFSSDKIIVKFLIVNIIDDIGMMGPAFVKTSARRRKTPRLAKRRATPLLEGRAAGVLSARQRRMCHLRRTGMTREAK